MGAIAKPYDVGDTVFARHPLPSPFAFEPKEEIVAEVRVLKADDTASVRFESGREVQDGPAYAGVFPAEEDCAEAILDFFIAILAPTVLKDTNGLSVASGAGNPATGLARVDA